MGVRKKNNGEISIFFSKEWRNLHYFLKRMEKSPFFCEKRFGAGNLRKNMFQHVEGENAFLFGKCAFLHSFFWVEN